MQIQRLHYFSGIILTLFIVPHLINHLQSLHGIEAHISTMEVMRQIYRNIVVECILLTAVVVQIVSGIRLFRHSEKLSRTTFEKLHVLTGLYLAFFFFFHVGAVLLGRSLLGLNTNFYFGAAGLNTFPFSLFFLPYYTLAIMAFFGHVASIHHKKVRRSYFGVSPGLQATMFLALGAVVTALTIYGMTNGFHGINLPQEYEVMVGK